MKERLTSLYYLGKETKTTLYDTVIVYPIIFLPVLIMFYIASSSFLNGNSSALVYGIGFIITLVFTSIVNRLSLSKATTSNGEGKKNPSEYCYYGIPSVAKSMIGYLRASPNAAIIMYTFMYFISATIVKNFAFIVNPILMLDKLFKEDLDLLIFFSCLLYFGKKVETKLQCNNQMMNGVDYLNGMVVGFFAFWAYVTLFFVIGKESFFIQSHFLSNKRYCTTPGSVTYRCKNKPAIKKYIIISNSDYIANQDSIRPHNDQYYDTVNDITVYSNQKIYLSPGTKIKYSQEKNGAETEIKYDDLSENDNQLTMSRVYMNYEGKRNNIKHYVGLRKDDLERENDVSIYIKSIE